MITVTLACWFASGIVFGFAALKPVFIRERVWRELCTEEELAENVEVCYRQDLKFVSNTDNQRSSFAVY